MEIIIKTMNEGETTIGILCKLNINCYLVKLGDREYCFNLGGWGKDGTITQLLNYCLNLI